MLASQIQTRRQSALAAKKAVSNENSQVSAKLAAVKSGVAVPAAGKKRAVLGDVSNVSAPAGKAALAAKGGKVAVVAEVASSRPRTRSSSAHEALKKATEEAVAAVKTRGLTVSSAEHAIKSSAPSANSRKSAAVAVTKPSAPTTRAKAVVTKKAAPKTEHPAPRPAADNVPVVKRAKTSKSESAEADEEEDLDAADAEDPLMLSEYAKEIYGYLREQEKTTMPKPDYMDDQEELQWKMRSILVDWLIEVHCKFRLLPETLFLSVNIIDRFLSCRTVALSKLQLVGVTAMFIAAKYEEVVAPSIQNFLYMADGGYDTEEILKAERYILQILDFGLSYPNPMTFLRRCSKADNYDIQTRTLAKYLMEVSLIDHRFLSMPPSMVAAGGLYLSRKMLGRSDPWDGNLARYSGYTANELTSCVRKILEYLQKPVKYEALYKKYASKKFMKASLFVKDWISRQDFSLCGRADDSEDEEEEQEEEERYGDENEEEAAVISETEDYAGSSSDDF